VIDTLLVAAVAFGLFLLLTKSFPKEGFSHGIVLGNTRHAFEHGSSNRTIWLVLVLLVTLAVFVVLPGLRGTSPGKAATKLRVVRADGAPPGIGRALIRWLLWIVIDSFPYFIPGLVGFVVALNSRGNQRVGDMAANTWVVRADAAEAAPAAP
jgi:uncharacterized RDD family membrane protein YckC